MVTDGKLAYCLTQLLSYPSSRDAIASKNQCNNRDNINVKCWILINASYQKAKCVVSMIFQNADYRDLHKLGRALLGNRSCLFGK